MKERREERREERGTCENDETVDILVEGRSRTDDDKRAAERVEERCNQMEHL